MATTSNFSLTPPKYTFLRYDSTLRDFITAVTATFASVEAYEDTFVPGRVLVIQQSASQYTLVGVVDPLQWFGFNFGEWSVHDHAVMQGNGNGTGFSPAA